MSFCDSPFADSIEGTIPSFTSPVSSSFFGSSAYNSIDLMSWSDEGCSDTMPGLVDPCPHHDSSSEEDSSDITIENNAKATRRSTRILPTVLLPSYCKEEDEDDDDGEAYDDEDETVSVYSPPFGTNRVTSYAKVRKRSKKKPTKQTSTNIITNPNESVEHHQAGSQIWSSPLCPKGICLVVQTTTAVHVVQDCPAGQVYVFRQLSSLVHLQQVESRLASYLKAGLASDLPVFISYESKSFFLILCNIE
jgi:hypothetical protein